MTDKSKRILAILTASVVVVLLGALIAVGAFALGRESAADDDKPNVTPKAELAEVADAFEDQPEPEPESGEGQTFDKFIEETDPDPTAQSSGQTPSSEAADSQQQSAEEEQEVEDESRLPVDLEEVDTELLLEVWNIINKEFDGSLPTSSDVTYQSIVGSMELLNDQFTRFIPPDVAERSRIQIQGGYEGIGAFVDLTDDGNLLIVRPIDGQPADRAGLLSGDIVTEVDGHSIKGMALVEIVAIVTGPRGTEVRLTILREEIGETFEITIVRERIDFPVVSSRMLDEGIGYVRLTTFSNGASQQLSEAIEELLASEPGGLILDLRDNPGGLLSESIEVSDLFLPEGIVAYQRDTEEIERIFESDDGDLAEAIALVVLINKGSASGSEIVAGAINDLDRGILIGETTLGKGSVQQSHTLSDGSELRVTIARWYTPRNTSIDKEGIVPDIEVETPADLGGDDDTQLQRAIEYLLSHQ